MATVRNIDKHPTDLTGGRILAPQGTASGVDEFNSHEANLIAAGKLEVLVGDPPDPDGPVEDIQVVAANAAPPGSIIYKDVDDDWHTLDPPADDSKVLGTTDGLPGWKLVSVDASELDFDVATQVELDAEIAAREAIVGLQAPANANYATANLVTNAREVGHIAMYKGWRVRRITTDRAARVRLYSSDAKRDADAARPIVLDPPDYPGPGASPGHGCMFEAVTDAAHLDLPVAPNVSGAELTGSNNIPITVDNLGANGVVNVTIYYQRIEP